MCWLQQSAQLWYCPTFLLYPLLVIAGIECFAGYYAWRFLIGVNGAVLGFVAGAVVGMMLGNPMLALLGAFAGAVGGAALFIGILPLGSFVFAFGSAASLAVLLGRVAGLPAVCYVLIAAIGGVACGLWALSAGRPAIIVLAAIAGAQQIAGVWQAYWLPVDSTPLPDVMAGSEWMIFLALAAAGLFIQFATSHKAPAGESKTESASPRVA